MVTDCFGRSHLYNAVRFDAAHVVDELIDAGVSAFMWSARRSLSANEAGKATSRVVRAIEAAKRGHERPKGGRLHDGTLVQRRAINAAARSAVTSQFISNAARVSSKRKRGLF